MRRSRQALPPGFGTIWTTVAIDLIGFGIVLPVLPQYAERFGASPTVVGMLLASFSVAQLLFAPLWGWLSDRVGRKPILIVSLAGTAVGSLLTGVAGSLALLFAGRVIDGISGASVSVAHASVADVAPRDQRARLFGMLGAAFAVGFVAGPAIGALTALWSPRLPFLVASSIAAANCVVALFRLPETHPAGQRGTDSDGAHTVLAQTVLGQTGLEDEGLAAVAAGPQVATVPRTAGAIGHLVAVAFMSLTAFSAFEATFALYGERRLHFHLTSTALVFTVIGLVLAVVQSSLVHPTVQRLGEAGTLRLGLAVNAVGLLVLAAVHSWWTLVPALAALVVGQGLAMPALTASFAHRAGASRGRVFGVQQSASGLARVVGPLAGGMAFQRVGPASPYVGGAVLMTICAASARERFFPRRPDDVTVR